MDTQQVYIGKDDSIMQIQQKFEDIFPNLCLCIFKHASDGKLLSKQDILISPEARMGDLNPLLEEAVLAINPDMTVMEFETLFFNKFGLFVQVSRIHNRGKKEESPIDLFTLNQANELRQVDKTSQNEIIYFRDVPYGC